MPFDLLLPPLLGGYLFITRFNGTSYRCSNYSGYRLLMSASVVALLLLLITVSFLEMVSLAQQPVLFHQIIFPLSSISILLILFGGFKGVRRSRLKLEQYETESDTEFKQRLKVHESKGYVYWLVAIVSTALLIALFTHSFWGWGLLNIPSIWAVLLSSVVAAILVVNAIKDYSDLQGFEVALRLGWILAIVSVLFVISTTYQDDISSAWGSLISFEYSGVSMLAFTIGASAWIAGNVLFPYEAAVSRLVNNGQVDGLEQLFYYASTTLQQVCVNLTDNKTYVGFVEDEIPIAGLADNFVKILPTASGYRTEKDRKLVLDTFYLTPFQDALQKDSELSSEDLAKVIPIDQILTAGIFSPELYSAFQAEHEKESARLAKPSDSGIRDKLRRARIIGSL